MVQEVRNAQDVKTLIQQNNIAYVKIAITDINGVVRSKYLSAEKCLSALEKGFGFCDVILGCDIDEQVLSNLQHTGWHTGFPDATCHIVTETCRQIPFEANSLLFIAEFAEPTSALCPRSILKNVAAQANDMGYTPRGAMEFEFTLFDQTIEELHKTNFQQLNPITPGNSGYSMLRNTVFAEFYQEVLETCQAMNIHLECLHTEVGPGVVEAAITVDDLLAAADKAILFKTMIKILARRRGWSASFMARWSSDLPGHSGHIHLSLNDQQGRNIFYDANDAHTMSPLMKQFLAGQLEKMPECLAMVAGTVNDYARLVPGFWAPTFVSWGIENRTCAVRVINSDEKTQRVEYRISAADSNPYLSMAAALASGLYGIQQQCALSEPITGNAYQLTSENAQPLPVNLLDAVKAFQQSAFMRQQFGDLFVDDYANSRYWEVQQAQKAVTDWQLQRYFELA